MGYFSSNGAKLRYRDYPHKGTTAVRVYKPEFEVENIIDLYDRMNDLEDRMDRCDRMLAMETRLDELDRDEERDEGDQDEEEVEVPRAPKRYLRDGENPFEFYSEVEFKCRFRFSKDSVMYGILPRIEAGLVKVNNRGLPIPPVMQLLVCLRFYGTASFQRTTGDLFRISQSTVSRIIFRVSVAIGSLIYDVIKMPATEEAMIANRNLFRELGAGREGIGLPDVDGAIDCTHVRLVHTKFAELQEIYRNRKGYFSLDVQAVVGPNMEFLDIVPEWPGSHHDSRIFQTSRIFMRYHKRQLTGTLVGDAGYPCLPFILTPIANPITNAQESYNNVQSRTRITVERAFGIWKRRFPCLSRGLGTKLICSTTIVVACAVLHNLAITLDNDLPEDDEMAVEEVPDLPPQPPHWQPGEGIAIRAALIERLFN